MPHNLLQKERNRFVGFSFATAQLLLELDETNRIVYAAGASFQIAPDATKLIGRQIESIVASRDGAFIAHILQRYREGRPGQLVRVALKREGKADQDFLVGGCVVDATPGQLYLGLVPAIGVARALAGSASKLAEAAALMVDEGDPLLTLYASRSLAELAESNPELSRQVAEDIQAYLRSVSVGGECVTDLAPGRYGFLRQVGVTDGEIEQSVASILTENDLEPAGQLFNIQFDSAELASEDAARALAYTIEKFARSEPAEFTLRSVQQAVSEMIGQSVDLMRTARGVLTEGSLEVAFQKVVEMRTGETHHFEALSRFTGIESVADFIRFMEESGIVQDLDLLVVEKVYEQLAEMDRTTGWRPKVAVNLSGRSIQGDIFRGRLMQLGQNHADYRGQMLFELTETSSITAIESTASFLHKLSTVGHAICLDDVGAGSTSLQMLRAMPANFIKLDGAVVHGASRPGGDRTLFKALVDLARGKGAELIAEQIETEADARFCAQAGARFGQGWLFGKASPDALLQRERAKPIDIGLGGAHTLRR